MRVISNEPVLYGEEEEYIEEEQYAYSSGRYIKQNDDAIEDQEVDD